MAIDAAQVQYRQEFIAAFEQRQTLLLDAVTTEAVFKGNQATFLVAGSGSDQATTRGANGLITAHADTETQSTATLQEWHDLRRKTKFNIFASQGNQRAIMQMNCSAVLNRKIDSLILTELATGTVTTGSAVPASLNLVARTKTILGNAGVPWDSNIWAVISPAFEGYLMQTKEFSSREYIGNPPVSGADAAWRDKPRAFFWFGVNWVVHPKVSGVGTSSESCFMFHKSAIGFAKNTEGMDMEIGYNGEQAYSWARCSMDMGPKLLQNTGVVEMVHDGSALSA
jgi:hypothetical protein